jgi:hypothetical protein
MGPMVSSLNHSLSELVLDGPDQFRPRNWSTSSHLGTGPVRTGSS